MNNDSSKQFRDDNQVEGRYLMKAHARKQSLVELIIALLFCGIPSFASAQVAYQYTIAVGPIPTIYGFSPSSFNNAGQIIYVDGADQSVSTLTTLLAEVGDFIGGEELSVIPSGSGTTISENGLAAFRARYDASGLDLDAIFTPTALVVKQWGLVGGTTVGNLSDPSINDLGEITFSATICPSQICTTSGIFNSTAELLRAPYSDGFTTVDAVSDPVINDDGVIAHFGYGFLADTSAAYLLLADSSEVRIVHTGESVAPGVILDNPRGQVQGLVLNEDRDIATCWNTEAGDWVVLKNDTLVAMEGDTIDGVVLTDIQNHRPAMNNPGALAFLARHASGDGLFTSDDLVLSSGQMIGAETLQFVNQPAINDYGHIAAHVTFATGYQGIVLATPLPEPEGLLPALAGLAALSRGRRQRLAR